MSALYTLVCNACGTGAKETSAKSLRFARMNNKPHGWTSPRPGVDFCPTCKPAPKAKDPRYADYF